MFPRTRKVLQVIDESLQISNYFKRLYLNFFFSPSEINDLLDEEHLTLELDDQNVKLPREQKKSEEKEFFSKEGFDELHRLPIMTGDSKLDIAFVYFQEAQESFDQGKITDAFELFKTKVIKSIKDSENEEARIICSKTHYYLGLCYMRISNKQKQEALIQFTTAVELTKDDDKNNDHYFCLIILEILKLLHSPEYSTNYDRVDKVIELNSTYLLGLRKAPAGSAVKKELSKKIVTEFGYTPKDMIRLIDESYLPEIGKIERQDAELMNRFVKSIVLNDFKDFTYKEIVRIFTLISVGFKIKSFVMQEEELKRKLSNVAVEIGKLLTKCQKEKNPIVQKEIARMGIALCLILELTQFPAIVYKSKAFKRKFMPYVKNDKPHLDIPLTISKLTKAEPIFEFVDPKDSIIDIKEEPSYKTKESEKEPIKKEKVEKKVEVQQFVAKEKSPEEKKIISTKEKKSEKQEISVSALEKNARPIHLITTELQEVINLYKTKTAATLKSFQELKNISESKPTREKIAQLNAEYEKMKEEYFKNIQKIENEKREMKASRKKDKTKLKNLDLMLHKKPEIEKDHDEIKKLSSEINDNSKKAMDFSSKFNVIKEEFKLMQNFESAIKFELKKMSTLNVKEATDVKSIELELKRIQSKINDDLLKEATKKLDTIKKIMQKIQQLTKSFQSEVIVEPKVIKNIDQIKIEMASAEKRISRLKKDVSRKQKNIQSQLSEIKRSQASMKHQLKESRNNLKKSMKEIISVTNEEVLKIELEKNNNEVERIRNCEAKLSVILNEEDKSAIASDLKEVKEKQDKALNYATEFSNIYSDVMQANKKMEIHISKLEKLALKVSELNYSRDISTKTNTQAAKNQLNQSFNGIMAQLKKDKKIIQKTKTAILNFEKFNQIFSKEFSLAKTTQSDALFSTYQKLKQDVINTEDLILKIESDANAKFNSASRLIEKDETLLEILEEGLTDNLADLKRLQSLLHDLNKMVVKTHDDINKKVELIGKIREQISKLNVTIDQIEKYDVGMQKININNIRDQIDSANNDCLKTDKDIALHQEAFLEVLKINEDLLEIREISHEIPDHTIEIKGGAVLLLGLYRYAKQEYKVGNIDDVDLLILSDNPKELSIRLQKNGFIVVAEDKDGKYIQLRKKGRSGKFLDVTIGDKTKYEGDEFITGAASGKAIIVDDIQDKNIDIQTGMGFGLMFKKELKEDPDFKDSLDSKQLKKDSKEKIYFKDFHNSIEYKKYVIQKYNPEKHEKYFKNIVKYKKKMVEIFGPSCLHLDKGSPLLKDKTKVTYGMILSEIKQHCIDELKLPKPKDRRIFLEINALIKCFGINDEDVKPYLEALIEAMIQKEFKNTSDNDLQAITCLALESIKLKYKDNPFLSDKNNPLLSSRKNIGTAQMRMDFKKIVRDSYKDFHISQVPKNYSQSKQIHFKPPSYVTRFSQFTQFSQCLITDEGGRKRQISPEEICRSPQVFSLHQTLGFTPVSKEQLIQWYQQNKFTELYQLYCPTLNVKLDDRPEYYQSFRQ